MQALLMQALKSTINPATVTSALPSTTVTPLTSSTSAASPPSIVSSLSAVSESNKSPKASTAIQIVNSSSIQDNPQITVKSTTLLLENMVSVEEASDPELKDEVADEAANYGQLVGLPQIEVSSAGVRIFVKYANADCAAKAFAALNGRYFGGKTVRASLV